MFACWVVCWWYVFGLLWRVCCLRLVNSVGNSNSSLLDLRVVCLIAVISGCGGYLYNCWL